ASPVSGSISPTTTDAPSRASSRAAARPMPEPAPVTIATFPWTRPMEVRPHTTAEARAGASGPGRGGAPAHAGGRPPRDPPDHASLSRLIPKTVHTIATPGKKAFHHATRKTSRPSLSMLPQAGVGG